MVPAAWVALPALPLTPNGKLDRKSLPALQPGPDAGYVRPKSSLEFQIAEIWEEFLGVRPIGSRSDFFELGGHSLLAVRMMNQIKEVFGVELPLASLFAGATIEHLAEGLLKAEREKLKLPLVEVQGGGSRQPFFFLHGDYNGGGFFCRKLARFLGSEQPFYVILPHGFGDEPIPRTIEAMAADRLQALLEFRPHGPYLLGGHCNGALIAFEMARQMEQRGLRADLVVIVDGSAVNVRFAWLRSIVGLLGFCFRKDRDAQADLFLHARRFFLHLEDSWRQGKLACLRYLWKQKKRVIEVLFATRPEGPAPAGSLEKQPQEREKDLAYGDVVRSYVPRSYKGRVVFLRTRAMLELSPSDPTTGWSRVAADLKVFDVPGNHLTCLTVHAKSLAETLSPCLQAAAPPYGGEPPTREESRGAAT
jgi:thioesterase domain-containing protein/acyl carrier protein